MAILSDETYMEDLPADLAQARTADLISVLRHLEWSRLGLESDGPTNPHVRQLLEETLADIGRVKAELFRRKIIVAGVK
jgi:hypothetical protein